MSAGPAKDPVTILKAVLIAFAGFSAWAIGDAAIRFVKDYPPEVIACIGSFFCVSLSLGLSPSLGGLRQTFTMPKLGLRILRGLIIAASSFLSVVIFSNLELATAYALIFIAPFLGKIFSIFMTGERISLHSWMITAIAFIGVLIVLRPGYVPLELGTVAALCGASLFALGHAMTRAIGVQNQTFLSMVIFQYGFVFIGTLIPAINSMPFIPATDLLVMLLTGLTAFGGGLAVSYAFGNAPAAFIAPVHYTQILWGIGLGILLFGEYPDIWTLAGGGVIIAAGIGLIQTSRKTPTASRPVAKSPR